MLPFGSLLNKQQMFTEYLIIPTVCRIISMEHSKGYGGNNLSTGTSALKKLELRTPE